MNADREATESRVSLAKVELRQPNRMIDHPPDPSLNSSTTTTGFTHHASTLTAIAGAAPAPTGGLEERAMGPDTSADAAKDVDRGAETWWCTADGETG